MTEINDDASDLSFDTQRMSRYAKDIRRSAIMQIRHHNVLSRSIRHNAHRGFASHMDERQLAEFQFRIMPNASVIQHGMDPHEI